MPAFVLGNGSDLVVADAGIRGLVIRNRAKDASIADGLLTAEAGSPMAMLVKRCTAEALAGLEFGISIPGTLGGAVWANAGAHDGEMRDVVEWVDAWHPATTPSRGWPPPTAPSPTASRASSTATRWCWRRPFGCGPATRTRSRRRWPRTRPSVRRPSRWPTRTPAASSATLRATMPAG